MNNNSFKQLDPTILVNIPVEYAYALGKVNDFNIKDTITLYTDGSFNGGSRTSGAFFRSGGENVTAININIALGKEYKPDRMANAPVAEAYTILQALRSEKDCKSTIILCTDSESTMIRIKQHLFYGPKVQYNSGHDLELERMAALIIKEVFARSTPVIFCKVLSKKAFGNIIVDIAAKVALASYEAITVVPARGCLEMKIEDMLEPITDLRTIIDQIRKSKSQNPH